MQIGEVSPILRPMKLLIVVRIVIDDSRSGSPDGSSLAVGHFMTASPMLDRGHRQSHQCTSFVEQTAVGVS